MVKWIVLATVLLVGAGVTFIFVGDGHKQSSAAAKGTPTVQETSARPPAMGGVGSRPERQPGEQGPPGSNRDAIGAALQAPKPPLAMPTAPATARAPAEGPAQPPPAGLGEAPLSPPPKVGLPQSPALTQLLHSPRHQEVASLAKSLIEDVKTNGCGRALTEATNMAAAIRRMGITAIDTEDGDPSPPPQRGEDPAAFYRHTLSRVAVNMDRFKVASKVLGVSAKGSQFACQAFTDFLADIRQDMPK